MVACAAIGFVDDYLKLTNRRSLGLSGRWKMLGLAAVVAGLAVVAHHEHLSTDVYLPVIDTHVPLGPGYYVFIFLVVAGAANAVNLTDGLDGLAAGTMTIAALTYSAMGVVAFLAARGLYPQNDPRSLDLAILAAALVGGCVGFLWYNAYPADIFMGDTGALGLGGALAALAVFTKTEVLLVIIGGVFVIEALSVAIQVIASSNDGEAGLPHGPDSPPLRDDGVDREQDHRPLLDHGGDLRGERLRPLLPLLLEVPVRGVLVLRPRCTGASRAGATRALWRPGGGAGPTGRVARLCRATTGSDPNVAAAALRACCRHWGQTPAVGWRAS